ncbi:MAG: carbohydrate porin, partial [Cyanobacteria bacterium K_DeepCast_35m_m1_288]|nr:carbohydrate porin [Cyanobacteria bacterium K_DeepCast_35m_m1_288]
LAVLKGRVDSLEAKVGELEATQFSTTTKLKGVATFVLGANSFFGTSPLVRDHQAALGATTFNYDVRLNFDTSFTGKDLLRTTLRSGNFGGDNGSAYGTGLSFMEAAFEEGDENTVVVNRLFYSFPVGSELNFGAGALIRVDDPGMLGIWPSAYPADTVLDFFTYAGAPGAYNLLALGGGAGFVYSPKGIKGLTISQNYVSAEGSAFLDDEGETVAIGNAGSGNPGNGGIFTTGAGSAAVTQIAYTGEKAPLIGGSYALAFAYTYSQNLPLPISTPAAADASQETATNVYSSANNLALSGYWKPEKTGFIPSISWGVGSGTYNSNLTSGYSGLQQTKGMVISTWYTGLQWDDAFIKGNALGMGVGQAPYIAKNAQPGGGTPNDSNYMWEWWYKFQVTDNISITPAIYYISNYDGAEGVGTAAKTTDNLFGGLLKTTFKF